MAAKEGQVIENREATKTPRKQGRKKGGMKFAPITQNAAENKRDIKLT
jgi:hypothetical protein